MDVCPCVFVRVAVCYEKRCIDHRALGKTPTQPLLRRSNAENYIFTHTSQITEMTSFSFFFFLQVSE